MTSQYDNAILVAVDEYWTEYCRPPTYRELMDLTGAPSTSVVQYVVEGLVRRGLLLKRGNGKGSTRTTVPLWVGAAVGDAADKRGVGGG